MNSAGVEVVERVDHQRPADPAAADALLDQHHRHPRHRAEPAGHDRPDGGSIQLGDKTGLGCKSSKRRQSASTWFQPAWFFRRMPVGMSATVMPRMQSTGRILSAIAPFYTATAF